MTSRRDFLTGLLTTAVAAVAPKWLPEAAEFIDELYPLASPDEYPIGFAFYIRNTHKWLHKVVEFPENNDVVLLDGETVQRPKNTKLPPYGIASVCKTGENAWAIWGDVS